MMIANDPEPSGASKAPPEAEGISFWTLSGLLLRSRRLVVSLALLGAVVGLLAGVLAARKFRASATFIPSSEGGAPTGGIAALAANQFGLRLQTGGATSWGPEMYVEVLRSRAVLEPLVRDTFVVVEEGNRRASLTQLFEIEGPNDGVRTERTLARLGDIVVANEDRRVGVVTLEAETKWPSISLALVERLLDRLNRFNLETRKSQAVAERQFVDEQALRAQRELNSAEDRLKTFLQRNRIAGSPELTFERERLEREVSLRQQLYTGWLDSREQARIREVRDTPVITVLEPPHLPVVRQPRRVVAKALLGTLAGAAAAILWILARHSLARERSKSNSEFQYFLAALRASLPRSRRHRA